MPFPLRSKGMEREWAESSISVKKRRASALLKEETTKFALNMKYKQLSLEQRYAISSLLKNKIAIKGIAATIGVCVSTIYRELHRNGNPRSYDPVEAHRRATARKNRLHKPRKYTPEKKRMVHKFIRERQWSPKQVYGYCRANGIEMVSHETIYADIRLDKAAGGDLWTFMLHRMKHRNRAQYSYKTPIPNRVDIDQRPPEADGTRFGDFEMDLIVGANGKQTMLTLMDRYTNMGMIYKLRNGKNAQEVAMAVFRLLLPYKRHLKTITTDNGPEFAAHELITKLLGVNVYFAKPYHSWEKGGIENYNMLVRQYIPKGADFNEYNDKMIMEIQKKINSKPRAKHGFKSPKQVFFNLIR